jgi:hypothetical protein
MNRLQKEFIRHSDFAPAGEEFHNSLLLLIQARYSTLILRMTIITFYSGIIICGSIEET